MCLFEGTWRQPALCRWGCWMLGGEVNEPRSLSLEGVTLRLRSRYLGLQISSYNFSLLVHGLLMVRHMLWGSSHPSPPTMSSHWIWVSRGNGREGVKKSVIKASNFSTAPPWNLPKWDGTEPAWLPMSCLSNQSIDQTHLLPMPTWYSALLCKVVSKWITQDPFFPSSISRFLLPQCYQKWNGEKTPVT